MTSGKVSKPSQDYRRAYWLAIQRCGTCAMFRPPDECSYVAGVIRSRDVCDAWSAFRKGKK